MIVAGGTYLESCREPGPDGPRRALLGSGLRAAAALREVVDDLIFHSAVDGHLRSEAETVTASLGITTEWRERSEPVGFDYWTPLSAPAIDGPHAHAEDILLDGGRALVFGMLECRTRGTVDGLVFDPQQPRDLRGLDLGGISAKRLAVIANANETRAMAAEADLEAAAQKLLEISPADVVITKRAARGCLVTTADAQEWVGPFPTTRVWPIGSGDVFAAGFAWAWLEDGAEPVEAARAGSHAASIWCSQLRLGLRSDDFRPASGELNPRDGCVYLAAPFFNLAQRWLVELVSQSVVGLGGDMFSPFHSVGVGDDSVADADIEGLERSSAVLALLDDIDGGALFESGWADKAGIPIVVYTEHPEREDLKMLRGRGAELHNDLPTAVYRALWASMGAAP